jgi:hypothetical protein
MHFVRVEPRVIPIFAAKRVARGSSVEAKQGRTGRANPTYSLRAPESYYFRLRRVFLADMRALLSIK